ncbi:MAG TPA: hypothetical protein VLJ38_12210 [Polyangiaceae bacterium]|nr:hypothetical protein [Polyangiaceae bacterium]
MRVVIERLVLRGAVEAQRVPWLRARLERELGRALSGLGAEVAAASVPVPPLDHPGFPAAVAARVRGAVARARRGA